jgi:hypothetical protein
LRPDLMYDVPRTHFGASTPLGMVISITTE